VQVRAHAPRIIVISCRNRTARACARTSARTHAAYLRLICGLEPTKVSARKHP